MWDMQARFRLQLPASRTGPRRRSLYFSSTTAMSCPSCVCPGAPSESPDTTDVSAATGYQSSWPLTFTTDRYTMLCAYQDGASAAHLPGQWRWHSVRKSTGYDYREMWLCIIAGFCRVTRYFRLEINTPLHLYILRSCSGERCQGRSTRVFCAKLLASQLLRFGTLFHKILGYHHGLGGSPKLLY